MKILYVAVSTSYNNEVHQQSIGILFNPIRQKFSKIRWSGDAIKFADSGGFQLVRFNDYQEKICLVIPGVGSKYTSSEVIIDPMDLCRCYGELEIDYGFTFDYPLMANESYEIFKEKLMNSYDCANLMFRIRKNFCPRTKLMIPLQFLTKTQLHHYYAKMSVLNPDGYAFPARGDICFEKIVYMCATLSFLHKQGVKIVHLFGSSSRETIIISGITKALRMFDQVSFDSSTWNTFIFNKKPKRIDPDTLKQSIVKQGENVLLFNSDKLNLGRNLSEQEIVKERILFHNLMAINRYTEKISNLSYSVSGLRSGLNNLGLNKQRLILVEKAFDILERYVEHGYGYIEDWLSWIW